MAINGETMLQSSGEIKMSQINTELGRTSTATISLDDAENGTYATINTASSSYPNASNPAAMSEWYSYDHSAAAGFLSRISSQPTTSSAEACSALEATENVYKNGTSTAPDYGDKLYEDSSLSANYAPAGGFGKWYKYEDGNGDLYSVYLLASDTEECVIEAYEAC